MGTAFAVVILPSCLTKVGSNTFRPSYQMYRAVAYFSILTDSTAVVDLILIKHWIVCAHDPLSLLASGENNHSGSIENNQI